MSKTDFSDRVSILSDLFMWHNGDAEWEEFFDIQDLGVPLAVAITQGGATPTDIGISWINESFDAMCEFLNIEDTGFSVIDEMMPDE